MHIIAPKVQNGVSISFYYFYLYTRIDKQAKLERSLRCRPFKKEYAFFLGRFGGGHQTLSVFN